MSIKKCFYSIGYSKDRTRKRYHRKGKRSSRLTKKYFGPEGEGMKKRQELIGPIQDAIYNAIKDIATQKNYDAVIDRASAQSMILPLHVSISVTKFSLN